MIAKPTYVRHVILDNELVAVERKKRQVCVCKPVYVGMSVLDLSKALMYDFLYNNLKVGPCW